MLSAQAASKIGSARCIRNTPGRLHPAYFKACISLASVRLGRRPGFDLHQRFGRGNRAWLAHSGRSDHDWYHRFWLGHCGRGCLYPLQSRALDHRDQTAGVGNRCSSDCLSRRCDDGCDRHHSDRRWRGRLRCDRLRHDRLRGGRGSFNHRLRDGCRDWLGSSHRLLNRR